MTQGQVGLLGLTCTALSSATSRRLIPAHSNLSPKPSKHQAIPLRKTQEKARRWNTMIDLEKSAGWRFMASFGLVYGFSMPKLQPTGSKTVQLEFTQTFGFLCFVRSVSDGVSGKIGLRTRRSGVRVPPGAPVESGDFTKSFEQLPSAEFHGRQ
jgi:hypothetical protein